MAPVEGDTIPLVVFVPDSVRGFGGVTLVRDRIFYRHNG